MKSRIFVVEDHDIMREAYRVAIEVEPDLELCGMAGTAQEALDAIEAAAPDLVLVDVSLPGMSGLELIERLGQTHPGLPALVVSGHHGAIYAERALAAGARGYLDKKGIATVFLDAIHRVLEGEIYLSEDVRTRS